MLATYQTIAALFILLGIASIIGNILGTKPHLSDLKQRILSWWFILPLFSIALVINGPVFLILLAFISFMGLKEFISSISIRQIDRKIIFVLYLAIPIQYILVWCHCFLFVYFIHLYMFLFIAFMAVITSKTKGMLVSIATLYWGLALTVYCISYLGYLSTLPLSAIYPAGGVGVVLYLVVLTQLNDVAQYCWGKLLGGSKIIYNVSPNKTIAGFVGGAITVSLLSIPLGALFVSLPLLLALLAGLIIAISGFFGDILLSAVKRDLEIKDFSSLIPAHGGILDRVDSLIVSAPLFYQFLNIIHSGNHG
jgi:phosphatidate cytidylyltransferase